MQLIEIELTNWGPFFGTSAISLSVSEASPVVLFRGENMRGKTSLLRAIIWGLYGEIRGQDGRTPIDVSRMVNIDALQAGVTDFGVRLKMSHNGRELDLERSGSAEEVRPGKILVSRPSTTLIPQDGHPYPESAIAEVISGILSRDISEFFLFDGEMLSRFEERLREEKSASQGFVRNQVERALGLPFLRSFADDLDAIQAELNASMEMAIRKNKRHEALSREFRTKSDELEATERDRTSLHELDEKLAGEIETLEIQMASVDEIKDLFYERASLEKEIAAADDTLTDYRNALAESAEANWWLPLAGTLRAQISETDEALDGALKLYESRIKLEFRKEQLVGQMGSGICPTCGQSVASHDSTALEHELAALDHELSELPSASVDDMRQKNTRLRRFLNGPALIERIYEQEQDLRRDTIRNDKRIQKVRQISERLAGNNLDIGSLEANLVSKKSTKARSRIALNDVESKRIKLKQELQSLGAKMSDQPEVDENERQLRKLVSEVSEITISLFRGISVSNASASARGDQQALSSADDREGVLGVEISDDYLLSVVDDQKRSLSMISAGANQILTMAFIGALAQCSIEEAPMVMDTPFGRLDVGHRSGILEWVSTFDSQVILFVQSGEYDTDRDAHLLEGKIGREYSIDRLSPTRSVVIAA